MFYPGDPIEERKRKLIARLAQRGGGSFGGSKVSRMPGFFGRGLRVGGPQGLAAAFDHIPAQAQQAPAFSGLSAPVPAVPASGLAHGPIESYTPGFNTGVFNPNFIQTLPLPHQLRLYGAMRTSGLVQ